MEPGQPYQDFVESEVRKFWQEETGHAGIPAQQIQQKVQAPAIPVHAQASQTVTDDKEYPDPVMAHHAVGAMIQHALEASWIKPPFSEACESPNYVEALIQLAYEADWLYKRTRLPDHPAPKHPTIYYTLDGENNRAVPREGCLIRGDYVYTHDGNRITKADFIKPWLFEKKFPGKTNLIANGWDTCYRLVYRRGTTRIVIYWLETVDSDIRCLRSNLEELYFSPQPPSVAGPGQ